MGIVESQVSKRIPLDSYHKSNEHSHATWDPINQNNSAFQTKMNGFTVRRISKDTQHVSRNLSEQEMHANASYNPLNSQSINSNNIKKYNNQNLSNNSINNTQHLSQNNSENPNISKQSIHNLSNNIASKITEQDLNNTYKNKIPLSHITEENIHRSNSKSANIYNSKETPTHESYISNSKVYVPGQKNNDNLSLPNNINVNESLQLLDSQQSNPVHLLRQTVEVLNYDKCPKFLLYNGPVVTLYDRMRFCDNKALDVIDLDQIKNVNDSGSLFSTPRIVQTQGKSDLSNKTIPGASTHRMHVSREILKNHQYEKAQKNTIKKSSNDPQYQSISMNNNTINSINSQTPFNARIISNNQSHTNNSLNNLTLTSQTNPNSRTIFSFKKPNSSINNLQTEKQVNSNTHITRYMSPSARNVTTNNLSFYGNQINKQNLMLSQQYRPVSNVGVNMVNVKNKFGSGYTPLYNVAPKGNVNNVVGGIKKIVVNANQYNSQNGQVRYHSLPKKQRITNIYFF
jgi:hypothetical protein